MPEIELYSIVLENTVGVWVVAIYLRYWWKNQAYSSRHHALYCITTYLIGSVMDNFSSVSLLYRQCWLYQWKTKQVILNYLLHIWIFLKRLIANAHLYCGIKRHMQMLLLATQVSRVFYSLNEWIYCSFFVFFFIQLTIDKRGTKVTIYNDENRTGSNTYVNKNRVIPFYSHQKVYVSVIFPIILYLMLLAILICKSTLSILLLAEFWIIQQNWNFSPMLYKGSSRLHSLV